MSVRAWRVLLVALVVLAGTLATAGRGQAVVLPPESLGLQPAAQASSGGAAHGAEEGGGGSLFDAWWARLFCLTLLIPIAGFVRRLFTGWLNLLGVDEERYAGMASAGAGGLITLGLATGAVLSAAGGGLGAGSRGLWNLVAGSRRGGAGSGAGPSGGGDGASSPPGGPPGGPPPGGPGGPAGGSPGPGGAGTVPPGPAAGEAPGGSGAGVVPPDDVKGEGLPEAGSAYEARRQAAARMREMAEAESARGKQAPGVRARAAATLGVLGDMAHAAGAFAGAAFGMGLGHLKVAEKSSEVFGAAMSAPFRMIEAFMRTPPPPARSSLDGARYRVA